MPRLELFVTDASCVPAPAIRYKTSRRAAIHPGRVVEIAAWVFDVADLAAAERRTLRPIAGLQVPGTAAG